MGKALREIRRNVRKLIWRYAPSLYEPLLASWVRLNHYRSDRIEAQRAPVAEKFVQRYGHVVQGGPFRGMKYVADTPSTSLAQLVGCYEAELHLPLRTVIESRPTVIIDIGCAEGYYAVGLARELPDCTVFAFDIDVRAQKLCRELALLNGVGDRVIVGAECSPAELERRLAPGAFVFCDCEGGERDLLDPAQAPNLRSANILVELHDHVFVDFNLTEAILARFKPTHEITLISQATRKAADYPSIADFLPGDQSLCLFEHRLPDQQWALIAAKTSGDDRADLPQA
jgi:hypothetical protein